MQLVSSKWRVIWISYCTWCTLRLASPIIGAGGAWASKLIQFQFHLLSHHNALIKCFNDDDKLSKVLESDIHIQWWLPFVADDVAKRCNGQTLYQMLQCTHLFNTHKNTSYSFQSVRIETINSHQITLNVQFWDVLLKMYCAILTLKFSIILKFIFLIQLCMNNMNSICTFAGPRNLFYYSHEYHFNSSDSLFKQNYGTNVCDACANFAYAQINRRCYLFLFVF